MRHATASLEPSAPPIGQGERGVRILVAVAVLALVAVAVVPLVRERNAPVAAAPTWAMLAPPAEMPMRTWRWIVVSAQRGETHLRISPTPGDPVRVEALTAWRLQRPVPGYPADAIVVSVVSPLDQRCEERLAGLAAEFLRHIPTLTVRQLGADRRAPPPGLDQERLRFLVRERL
jgi:hypothetical protein